MSATINGQLVKKILIEGTIKTITGLHIGGSNMGMSIGGADATVVRNPLTNEPYIPGSSLKGKMRSLLERIEGKFGPSVGSNVQVGPYTDINDTTTLIPKIFGTLPERMGVEKQPPTRLIVRDCPLTSGSKAELDRAKNTDMPFTEVKTEVVIDRITSSAVPRQMERVPAGAKFSMSIILNVYHGDIEQEMISKVFEGLMLVQNDYLGGKGTRGSGEVAFSINTVKYKDKVGYEQGAEWVVLDCKIPTELHT